MKICNALWTIKTEISASWNRASSWWCVTQSCCWGFCPAGRSCLFTWRRKFISHIDKPMKWFHFFFFFSALLGNNVSLSFSCQSGCWTEFIWTKCARCLILPAHLWVRTVRVSQQFWRHWKMKKRKMLSKKTWRTCEELFHGGNFHFLWSVFPLFSIDLIKPFFTLSASVFGVWRIAKAEQ